MNEIINGDSSHILKMQPADSIDLVCTDPPYGYAFMNKDWDKAVPSVDLWKEVLRVLKPGAFAFVMSSPRQDVLSQMIVRLSSAGFETGFTSLYWAYASGFPKAANISKLVDKRLGAERKQGKPKPYDSPDFSDEQFIEQGSMMQTHTTAPRTQVFDTEPASEQAQQLDGSYGGFQPKPAVEVIIVAMKPLSEKTYVDQALANGKGITWLDDARIPYQSEDDLVVTQNKANKDLQKFQANEHSDMYGGGEGLQRKELPDFGNPQGRFPANLLVSDDILNDGRITASKAVLMKPDPANDDRGTWQMHPRTEAMVRGHNYEGSFSRYFDLDMWAQKTLPFLIVPKASAGEKNEGLINEPQTNDGRNIPPDNAFQRGQTERKNRHPTVKPLKLMEYLITLGSRANDLVLDPFCGSGTTCVAAKILRRNYLGIELQAEYAELARHRIATEVQTTLF